MIGEHKFIHMNDGVELHAQIREVGSRVWLIATHGIGEHLERHKYLVDLFGHDFNILQYDLRGHGRSMGESAYIKDFNQFADDLGEIVTFLHHRYKMKRYVLFAHSMGALINSNYLQNYADPGFYPERVFFNAPPVGYPGALGEIIKVSPRSVFRTLAGLPLSFKLGGLVDLRYLSHDSRIKQDYETDPLNAMKLHSKLLLEMVKSSGEVYSRPIRPHCPAFVTAGSEDRVIDVESLKKYFTMVEKGFKLKIFKDAYHEIHNEVDKYKKPYFDFLKKALLECVYEETLND